MNTISFLEGYNVGGVAQLLLAPFYLLNNLTPVTFRGGYDWTNMEFLPESANCTDTAISKENGTEYTYKIVLGFNKQSQMLYYAFAPYLGNVGICQFTDNNGLTRIIGTRSNRITIATAGDTGSKPADANDYTITITWVNHHPAQLV